MKTTQPDRQVWPSLRPAPAPAPKPAPVPREDRKPVTLADVRVGDTLSFLTDELNRRRGMEECNGVVDHMNSTGTAVFVKTQRGVVVLTKNNWERRAPRR